RSVRSSAAVADSTSPALTVHTRGRKRPVASAKPATAPDGSAAGTGLTAKAGPAILGSRGRWPRAAATTSGSQLPVAGEKYPVPEASPRSVAGHLAPS